jgi:FtsP/CotA-like multicopper oxidase with cupredoxin domain
MALPLIRRGIEPPEMRDMFLKFICPPTFSGGPLDPQPVNRVVARTLDLEAALASMIDIALPPSVAAVTREQRADVRMWIIEDPNGDQNNRRTFPSPIIRTVEGDVVRADVGFSFETHTIHWHGIEPTPMNDGVGHTSFEATSSFVYQFATHQAGTYFYHCHKNTVLHFEMGLYGLLIVDPPNPDPNHPLQAPYATGGPGLLRANAPGFPGFDPLNFTVPYAVEALWVTDEFDSVWHRLGHNAFMQNCDAGNPNAAVNFSRDGILNDFIPDIFTVTGVIADVVSGNLNNLPIVMAAITPETATDPRTTPPPSLVSPTLAAGQTLLVRLLNAGYTTQEYTLGLDALVVATDGVPFGIPGTRTQYAAPFVIPAGTPFRLTTARRIDLLLRPAAPGIFPFTTRHLDWQRSVNTANPARELVWGIQTVNINVT